MSSKYAKWPVPKTICRLSSWGHFSDHPPIWTSSCDLTEWSVSHSLVYCSVRLSFFITLLLVTKINFRICFSWRKMVTPSFCDLLCDSGLFFTISFLWNQRLYKVDDFFTVWWVRKLTPKVESVAYGGNSVRAHQTPELCCLPGFLVKGRPVNI